MFSNLFLEVSASADENLSIYTEESVEYNDKLNEISEDNTYLGNVEENNTTQNDSISPSLRGSGGIIKWFKKVVINNWEKAVDVLSKAFNFAKRVVESFGDSETGVQTNPSGDLVGYGHQTVGGNVREVQKLLNQHGYALAEDGIFGPNTYNAIVNFQKSRGLVADGIVGYNTWNALYNK